jgi:hypothetical protein
VRRQWLPAWFWLGFRIAWRLSRHWLLARLRLLQFNHAAKNNDLHLQITDQLTYFLFDLLA